MNRSLILLGLLALLNACGDGQPLFPDQDGDGIPDDTDTDDNGDGIPDDEQGGGDDDGGPDTDGDGIPDDEDNDIDGDGIPNGEDEDDDGDGIPDEDDLGGVGGDPELPPGTANPQPDESIVRFEAENDQGGGFVRDVSYDRATDTFTVDNLAFDGDNVYTRDDDVPTLSSGNGQARYAVYEANPVERDPVTGEPIGQLQYRAIYGVSSNRRPNGEPVTQFAIVRSGSYTGYGFGGFIYERSGGVDLPTSGQATYAGEYAGERVFNGRGGLEYTRGDVEIDIDFEDFNAGSGVKGVISNREAYDINGNPIALGGPGELVLPDLVFDIGPGTVTEDGEMSNELRSYTVDESGNPVEYEAGTYYAIVAGDNADEIVGIFVVESDDPRFEGVTAQETGGFIVYR